MDLTPALSAILVQAHAKPLLADPSARLTHTLDSFLKEAYQINASLNSLLKYLQSIRQPYLSNAPAPSRRHAQKAQSIRTVASETPTHLSDDQRTTIDTETSSLLRDLNASIGSLAAAAELQHDTATKLLHKKYGRPSSLLFRWAAGSDSPDPDAGKSAKQVKEEGQVRTTKDSRDGVLWYLRSKLEAVARRQANMVDARVQREREKQMSVLSDVRNKNVRSASMANGTSPQQHNHTITEDYGAIDLRGHDTYNPALSAQHGYEPPQDLSPEQLQLFSEENNLLHEHFNDQLTKITQAEKSLLEIGSLQQTLLGHLTVQGEQIGNLVGDAEDTEGNLTRGNKELKKASERGSTAKMVFWGSAGLCGFLVVWDLIF